MSLSSYDLKAVRTRSDNCGSDCFSSSLIGANRTIGTWLSFCCLNSKYRSMLALYNFHFSASSRSQCSKISHNCISLRKRSEVIGEVSNFCFRSNLSSISSGTKAIRFVCFITPTNSQVHSKQAVKQLSISLLLSG